MDHLKRFRELQAEKRVLESKFKEDASFFILMLDGQREQTTEKYNEVEKTALSLGLLKR